MILKKQSPNELRQHIETSTDTVSLIDQDLQSCPLPDSIDAYFSEHLDTIVYAYQEWISPCYLDIDFNDDQKKELLIPIIRKSDKKKGLAIQNPNGDMFLVGAGNTFGTSGDNLKWVDHWDIFASKQAPRTLHSPEKEMIGVEHVSLEGEALVLTVEEGPTVYIAWVDNRFEWILLDG